MRKWINLIIILSNDKPPKKIFDTTIYYLFKKFKKKIKIEVDFGKERNFNKEKKISKRQI